MPLPRVRPSLCSRHHPISFPKGAGGRRKNAGKADPVPDGRTSPPGPEERGRAKPAAPPPPPGCACAVHWRPLEWHRVSGLTAPPRVRLRRRRARLSCFPSPCGPAGGSGSGGTMFTSTGSSGLCEYRLPPSWLSPTRDPARLEEPGGSGVTGGWRGRASWRPLSLVVPARRGQRAPPPLQSGGAGGGGGEWGPSPGDCPGPRL